MPYSIVTLTIYIHSILNCTVFQIITFSSMPSPSGLNSSRFDEFLVPRFLGRQLFLVGQAFLLVLKKDDNIK
jgi:hypothetical protein